MKQFLKAQEIVGKKSHLFVIWYALQKSTTWFTAKEVYRHGNFTLYTLLNASRKLAELGILEHRFDGYRNEFCFNKNNNVARALKTLYSVTELYD